MGNVDVKHIKVGVHRNGMPKGPLVTSERIARCLSKYMSKDLIFVITSYSIHYTKLYESHLLAAIHFKLQTFAKCLELLLIGFGAG